MEAVDVVLELKLVWVAGTPRYSPIRVFDIRWTFLQTKKSCLLIDGLHYTKM